MVMKKEWFYKWKSGISDRERRNDGGQEDQGIKKTKQLRINWERKKILNIDFKRI